MKKFWMRWDYLKIGLKLNNVQAVYSKKRIDRISKKWLAE